MVSLFSYSGICQFIPLVTRINTFSWVPGEHFMSPGLNGNLLGLILTLEHEKMSQFCTAKKGNTK